MIGMTSAEEAFLSYTSTYFILHYID